jgi:hypothetical protein
MTQLSQAGLLYTSAFTGYDPIKVKQDYLQHVTGRAYSCLGRSCLRLWVSLIFTGQWSTVRIVLIMTKSPLRIGS